jgi:hypothetical protein
MAKQEQKDTPWGNLLTTLLVVAGMMAAGGFAFKQWQDNRPRALVVTVQLDNQCDLIDDAFILVSTDGSSAEFVKGMATLSTMSDARVSLKSSPKYPYFGFQSPPVKVKPELTLAAQCSSTDSKIEALREQFQRKK